VLSLSLQRDRIEAFHNRVHFSSQDPATELSGLKLALKRYKIR
jgi:hypothetical protein